MNEIQEMAAEIEELEEKLKLANRYKEDANRSLNLMALTNEVLENNNKKLEAEINSLGKIMLIISRTTHCNFCAKDNKSVSEDFDKALNEHMGKFPVRTLT